MDLVLFLQATQDSNGIFHTRLTYHDRLETTFQSSILFDVLAVFIQRGGTDSMQFATSQGRLEHVACIHGAIARRTSTYDGVQLIDEQDDLTIGLLHFAQYCLQTVFEFTTVFSTCQHCWQIQGNKFTVL